MIKDTSPGEDAQKTIEILHQRIRELEEAEEKNAGIIAGLMKDCTKFETIVKNVSEYIYSTTYEEGSVVNTYHSPRCLDVTGYSPEEYGGNPHLWYLMIHEDDRERVNQFIRDVSATFTANTMEHRIMHKQKGLRWVSNTCSAEVNESGALIRLNGFILDITDKKNAEADLRESEERYRSLFENNHAVMLLIEPESGKFFDVNPAAERYYGYSRHELRNMKITDINTLSSSAVIQEMQHAKLQEQTRFFFRHRLRGGEIRDVEVFSGPIRANRQELLYSIVHDITDRKRAEAALRLSEETLRQRNELMEKDLKIAQVIQKALLPREIPINERLRIDYRYIPYDAVGGDYFSFTPLQHSGMGVFIGDVAGHGISSALFLSLIKNVTDRVSQTFKSKPREFIKQLNAELIEYMQTYFITAIYGVFRFSDRARSYSEFSFSNGGHPNPVFQKGSTGKAKFINAIGSIVGIFPEVNYSETTVDLEKGDRIFLYTDGLVEVKNENGKIFGFDELSSLVEAGSKPRLDQTLDSILGEITTFKGGIRFDDDVVLIGIEVI